MSLRLPWLVLCIVLCVVLGCSVVVGVSVRNALGYNWGAWLFGCLGLCCLLCYAWCLAVRLSWVFLFVVLCVALGCSVVVGGSICGAWLGYNRVGRLLGCRGLFHWWCLGWAMKRGRTITRFLSLYHPPPPGAAGQAGVLARGPRAMPL